MRRDILRRHSQPDAAQTTHYNSSQTPQKRLAKYKGRVALVGAFAEGYSTAREIQEEENVAEQKIHSLVKSGFFASVKIAGIWSLAPPEQPATALSSHGTARLLTGALVRLRDTTVLLGHSPIGIYQDDFETPAESAHKALDEVLCEFEQTLGQSIPAKARPVRDVAILIVTDSVYAAATFGVEDRLAFDDQEIAVLAGVGASPDDNIWIPPSRS